MSDRLKLIAPNEGVAAAWREMFPGVEVLIAAKLPTSRKSPPKSLYQSKHI